MAIKQTKWEKSLIEVGVVIVTWDHEIIMDTLLDYFYKEEALLLLKAAVDDTNRRTLQYSMDFENAAKHRTNIRGCAIYNKKLRKFTHIQYSDRYNWQVLFSINSKASFFAREWHNQLKHAFPFGGSAKNVTHYLMQT